MSATMLDDLYRLCALLVDELDGRPIDRQEAQRLAQRLLPDCPFIPLTLERIGGRMQAPAGDDTARFWTERQGMDALCFSDSPRRSADSRPLL